jgi:hypothetical protein
MVRPRQPDADRDDALQREIDDTVEAFLTAQRAVGRTHEWIQAADFVCSSLLDFQLRDVAAPVGELGAPQIEEYLFEHFPEKVSASAKVICAAPEILRAFFDWLAAQRRVAAARVRAVHRRIEDRADEFVRRATAPQSFGHARFLALAVEDACACGSGRRARECCG